MVTGLIAMVLAQAAASETLVAPMPRGFRTDFEQAQGGQTIEERVPKGESVQDWTRMVTIQRLAGIAWFGAPGFAERLRGLWTSTCPGADVGEAVPGRDGDVATVTLRVTCPNNPTTGKPETMFARIHQGTADLHIVQYAFRSLPDADAAAAATAYLDSVHLRR